MGSETVLTIFVAIAAIAFLVQAIGVILIYLRINAATQHMNQLSGDIRQKFNLVVGSIGETTQHVNQISGEVRDQFNKAAATITEVAQAFKPLGEHLKTISANMVSISHTARTRAEELDYFVGETTETVRRQVHQINEVVAQMTARFEDTANKVQRGIVAPINEISAMVKGLKVGFGFLFSRWPSNSMRRPPSPDDELFI